MMRLRRGYVALAAGLAFVAIVHVANAPWMVRPAGELRLLAHRGVHQRFDREG
jgi:hypothetical protein